MTDPQPTFQSQTVAEPPSDLFVAEGEDRCWAWIGNHTRQQAIGFARHQHGIEGPVRTKRIRADIELRPGEVSDADPWLVPNETGQWYFWMVEAA